MAGFRVQNCSVMFIYQEILRTVNRIKRTSGIITVNLGTMLAIHNLERKNILRSGLTT